MKTMTGQAGLGRRRSPRGVALVITLLMVAMLAFLVVAFFSRTTANRQIESATKGGISAEILGRSGADAVVADLRAEVIAGSTVVNQGANRPVYLPTTNLNAVPSRVLASPASMTNATWKGVYANLLKQSVMSPSTPFFPAAGGVKPTIEEATAITTDAPSVNGRYLNYQRWQRSELNGINAFTASGSIHMPRWIMVTREGFPGTAQTWSPELKDYAAGKTKAAVGRFAFNVYDTGGLLDVNAIGYPKTPALSAKAIQELKGSLTGADLSVEFTNSPAATPLVKNVDLFTKSWKYLATGSSEGTFMAAWRDVARGGFLVPAAGDNLALGRQDLIRLAKKTVDTKPASAPLYGIDGNEVNPKAIPADDTPSALPYLTHFSRVSSAPGWFPSQDASAMGGNDGTGSPKPYAYKTNANNPAVPNRALPGVWVTKTFTRADGTAAVVGEPLVKTRFALARLAGLGPTGPVTTGTSTTLVNGVPSPATAATIRRDFGLVWDSSVDPMDNQPRNRWSYVETAGTSTQPKIMTLDQVAQATPGREPNFFELLKAGILSGSLGDSSDFESFCSNIGSDSNPDNQIIQIGANVIDQADADSFPTRIAFGFETDWTGGSVVAALSDANRPTPTGEPKVFSGVEDIPYLHSILFTPYRLPAGQANLALPPVSPASPDPAQTPTRDYINCWLQFVLWKPQQQTNSSSAPTVFRVVYSDIAKRGIYVDYFGSTKTPVEFPKTPPSGIYYNPRNTAPPLPDQATVNFSDKPTDFRVPTLLGGMGSTSDHGFNCSQPQGNGGGGAAQTPRGMWMGETYRPEKIYTTGSPNKDAPPTAFLELDCSNDSTFSLQYQDAAGLWRTYQRYNRFGLGTINSGGGYFRGRGRYGFTDAVGPDGGLLPQGNPGGIKDQYPHYTALDIAQMGLSNADPRSQRFGLMAMYLRTTGPGSVPPVSNDPLIAWKYFLKQGWTPASTPITAVYGPSNAARFSPSWGGGAEQNPWGGPPGSNASTFIPTTTPITNPSAFFADNTAAGGQSYRDQDGVLRRADGDSPNNVRPMQLASATTANATALGLMLNRPFRNVGELSYAFRDNPWKTLDFFSANSADGALLDLFSVSEQPAVLAGKISLNTRNPVALQAVLVNALRDETTLSAAAPNLVQATTGGAISAKTMADNLVANTSDISGTANTGPLLNVADLANRLTAILPVTSASDQAIKTRREVVGRALAGVGQASTWNLMVDVVAQSGRFPVTATKLEQFVVEGEKRYWLHVAIDRLTGQVIDQQLESVNE